MQSKLVAIMQSLLGQTSKKALALMLVLFAFPSKALAQSSFDSLQGEVAQTDVATITGLERIFSNIVTVVLELSGIVLFVMFLIGGFKFLTSKGDPKAVESARGTLTHAITGLIILVLAVVFMVIIENITGANVTDFKTRVRP